jgi:hypothetical protein
MVSKEALPVLVIETCAAMFCLGIRLDLNKRVTRVSLDTMKIVNGLPALNELFKSQTSRVAENTVIDDVRWGLHGKD